MTPIDIYRDALNEATADFFESSPQKDCSKEVGILLGCLLDYTYRIFNASFKDDKDFHFAIKEYAETLKVISENRNGLGHLTQEMVDAARAKARGWK